jgi:hypothetical protein
MGLKGSGTQGQVARLRSGGCSLTLEGHHRVDEAALSVEGTEEKVKFGVALRLEKIRRGVDRLASRNFDNRKAPLPLDQDVGLRFRPAPLSRT